MVVMKRNRERCGSVGHASRGLCFGLVGTVGVCVGTIQAWRVCV